MDIANGDARARTRIYYEVIVFEWVSALLALLALGFDWIKLNPKFLALDDVSLVQAVPRDADFARSIMIVIVLGLTASVVGVRLISRRRGAAPTPAAPGDWRSKLIPDFTALIPVTARERFLMAAVAISAGICEEIVFRGWLLSTLHGPFMLNGTALILAAATIFGLVHAYQGITGIVGMALGGVFFCVLYAVTGSLLAPILLHILIDLRFAFLSAPQTQNPRAVNVGAAPYAGSLETIVARFSSLLNRNDKPGCYCLAT